MDGRLSWPSWLTHSGEFTQKAVYLSTIDHLQVRESPLEFLPLSCATKQYWW